MIIGAITIETTEIDSITKFYQSALEISDDNIVRIRDEHTGFSLDNTYLGFDKVEETENGSNTIIWFRTEEVEELFNKFVEAGAKIVYKPNDEMSPGEILAELKDPQGNKIGIIGPAN